MFHACIKYLLITGSVTSFSVAEPTAHDITKNTQRRLDGITSLSANFILASHLSVLDQAGESTGRLFLVRDPNKLRLEQESHTIVSDGESVWTYVPKNQQIIVSPMEPSGGMRPDEFLFYYARHYTPKLKGTETIGGIKHYILELIANDGKAQLERVTVLVDNNSWLTRKVQYVDDMESSTTISFSDIRLNPRLPEETFVIVVPEGVEVVDLR
ncbi:MAG: outer membrane lipoprotein carrier protein LolA [Gemmatimonadota bacterium]|nr:outer membrane lipoprotein carrier protein LolA [Gemmatimonadota bacterium]